MKIEKVKVAYGRTVNLGNFESMRVDVEFQATIDAGETPENVCEKLETLCKSEVKRIVLGKKSKPKFEELF